MAIHRGLQASSPPSAKGDAMATTGELCILTNWMIRLFVRSIIERVRPATVVLQNEIHTRARVRVRQH
jgi:hypothetical protein